MARKGAHKRTLTSRKTRFKNVSSAKLDAPLSHMPDPPKAGFEMHMPRKMREMQLAMQRVKDREAGIHVEWRAHREDLPRPQQPKNWNKKRKAEDPATAASGTVHADATLQSRGDADALGGRANKPNSELKSKKAKKAKGAVGVGAVGVGAVVAGSNLKHSSQQSSRPIEGLRGPRFGETNAAPPTLLVGGQLKKMVAKRAQQQKHGAGAMIDIARQREQAIKAYAMAKAARREGARAEESQRG